MAWIKVIGKEEAIGELKEIYEDLEKKRGKLAHIHTILSQNPAGLVAHMDLYMTLMFGSSPLKRYQREMIGVVVSATNECAYCVQHHAEALDHYWKDEEKVELFAKDHTMIELSAADRSICEYAAQLTEKPVLVNEDLYIEPMRAAGLDDRAIVDAAQIIAYFNFVNRLVLGLGVEIEADSGVGYKYDA